MISIFYIKLSYIKTNFVPLLLLNVLFGCQIEVAYIISDNILIYVSFPSILCIPLTALYIMFFIYSIFYITLFCFVLIFDGDLNYWCFIWAYNFSFLTENFIFPLSLAFVCTVTHIMIYSYIVISTHNTLTLSLKNIMHVFMLANISHCVNIRFVSFLKKEITNI